MNLLAYIILKENVGNDSLIMDFKKYKKEIEVKR